MDCARDVSKSFLNNFSHQHLATDPFFDDGISVPATNIFRSSEDASVDQRHDDSPRRAIILLAGASDVFRFSFRPSTHVNAYTILRITDQVDRDRAYIVDNAIDVSNGLYTTYSAPLWGVYLFQHRHYTHAPVDSTPSSSSTANPTPAEESVSAFADGMRKLFSNAPQDFTSSDPLHFILTEKEAAFIRVIIFMWFCIPKHTQHSKVGGFPKMRQQPY